MAIHKNIFSLDSPLNVWYLDDGAIGGSSEVVLEDLKRLRAALKAVGLTGN